ncbi:Ribosomal protein S18 acetylase RimI [Luteibacter sp. UNC138MFCol5.1]|uniref:GNAT family N-acetyltransferase n=1 Tax=Luteibacter sp. UNC138MFCol5.1 TaxID=1502774 RepID=UPI0008CBFBE1|nr:GNAT family N-acetyltransferase [Luteibacter sp. UNC138MFCol5.1]SEP11015.1 Ribosomal protein S18 acetylase RimI [Luteibacter sp. UNC138MFCol5.1]
MSDSTFLIRLAESDDDDFILGLVPRFINFPLPNGRTRTDCLKGIEADLVKHLDEQPSNSYIFVAENEDGDAVGFVHIQKTKDFFTHRDNCHISDIAVAEAFEGAGVGRVLLDHAYSWAKEHRCQFVTLAVLPGNENAQRLYRNYGFDTDLMRMAKPVR